MQSKVNRSLMTRLRQILLAFSAALLVHPGLALAAGPAEVQPESGWGMPRDVSADGYGSQIDWLINITTVFVTILFVIMCVWMLYAALKHNRSHKAEYDHGNSKHSVKTALGIS